MFDFFANIKGPTQPDSYFQAQKAFQLDPDQDFITVKNRIGLDAATAYADQYFKSQPEYRRLRSDLEFHKGTHNQLNSDYDVLIVMPPHGSLNHRHISEVQRLCVAYSLTGGFSYVSVAKLNSDNALEGARRLTRMVEEKARQNRKLLIVSFSYGSSFVRIMLDRMEKVDRSHIKGWLNLSGLIFGTPRFHCSDKRKIFGGQTMSRRSFSSEQVYFQGYPKLTPIKVVHVLGLKLQEKMSVGEVRAREFLKAWGPNDGLVPFANYQNIRQPVVSLLNQGHSINLSSFSSSFVGILSAMVSTLPVSRKTNSYEMTKIEFTADKAQESNWINLS